MLRSGFHFEDGVDLFTIEGQEIPVILALLAAAIAVEIVLSMKKDGRLGLVLPGIRLLWTAVRLLIRVVQAVNTAEVVAPVQLLLLAWLVENIPTLILLAVYGLCRVCRRQRTKRQLKKTRINDL